MSTDVGRRALFEAELLPHLDRVFGLALRLLGERAAAEDATQETLLKAYRSIDSYTPGTSPRAWLQTILRRVVIDHRRRSSARPAIPLSLVAEPLAAPLALPILDGRDGFDERVARALDGLPSELRQAMLLCDVDGLSYQEIADLMDCPLGTVRSRINRARARMRERLAESESSAERELVGASS